MAMTEQLALGLEPSWSDDSLVDDLPDGWRLVRFDAVCEINPSRKGRMSYADDVAVTFVPMSAIDETTGTIARPEIKPFGAVKKGYTWFLENDVLFAKITPCMQNGKAAIARNLSNGVGFGSTEFHVLRPRSDVLPEWVYLFVRQPSFRAAAAEHFTGSVGQQRVPESFLATYLLPLPPLSEQRRIVARIEELAIRIERARRLRQKAAQEVEAVMPSALLVARDAMTRAYKAVPLGQIVEVKGGGTPSTQNPAFWGGDIPWVTPKDM
jgi:type I restriction enzyme S subunit